MTHVETVTIARLRRCAVAAGVTALAAGVAVLAGWVRLTGEEAGFYGTAFGLAAFVCTSIVAYLAWWIVRTLNHLDAERAASDAAAHDVLYERTLERDAAKDQAESADRLKTDFIMSVSHELRTPLNSIIGFTGTLLMGLAGPLTSSQAEQLRIIQANGRRLLLVISDVLDVARIESGPLGLASELVDLAELIRGVASQIGPLAEEKALRIMVDVPPPPVMVQTDPRALERVLLNLAGNAVKFTTQGTITLALSASGEPAMRRVEVSVSDTGVGIADADRSKLFTKFGRLANASGDDAWGMGLGLYLSRVLVEQLGGTIEVDSALGKGSRFSVAFDRESDYPVPLRSGRSLDVA